MSALSALAAHYDRLAARGEVAPVGYAPVGIGFEVVIDGAGEPLRVGDLRDVSAKKAHPRSLLVPAPPKRTVAIAPAFLWDKTAYALGAVAETIEENGAKVVRPGQGKRTADEHAAFAALHAEVFESTDDAGLLAFLAFLRGWSPDRFGALGWATDMLDQNVVFRLDGDAGEDGTPRYLHERPVAREAWGRLSASGGDASLCLVTGRTGTIARLHPTVKGVVGAQSSGASLVSFNLAAFESHGQSQGENAPVSTDAAHAYGTALNALLAKGGRNARVGDTTVAYWAEPNEGEAAAAAAEDATGGGWFDAPVVASDDPEMLAEATRKLARAVDALADGEGATDLNGALHPRTRLHVLGLAPNNARLSLRFHHRGTMGEFAQHLRDHWNDMAIEPRRWGRMTPPAWQLVQEAAAHAEGADGRWKRIGDPPPRLATELLGAILSGGRYPRTLARMIIMRVRAERGRITERRAALLLAAHNRDARIDGRGEALPVALDTEETDEAYLLGRLFALYEWAEDAASGGRVAALRDRYFAAASATPGRVFGTLATSYTHDLAKLRKGGGKGLAVRIERTIGEVMGKLPPHLPRTLSLENQVPFSVGYYHQAQDRYAKRADADGGGAPPPADDETDDPTETDNATEGDRLP